MNKIVFFTILLTAGLTACEQNKPKTVDYYLDHPEERHSKAISCYKNNDKTSEECINVKKADVIFMLGSNNKKEEMKAANDFLNTF